MIRRWSEFRKRFPENAEREFELYIAPYRFIAVSEWAHYRYPHWVIYGPESETHPKEGHKIPIFLIGGDSKEYEARNMAIALSNARKGGREEVKAKVKEVFQDLLAE